MNAFSEHDGRSLSLLPKREVGPKIIVKGVVA
jgi:hypothetical protein